MIKIISLRRTCIACPSQWEGISDDGRTVLIRYRHGNLSVSYMNPSESENNRFELEAVYEKELCVNDFVYGESFSDGFIEDFTTIRMILANDGVVSFSDSLIIKNEEWIKR